MFDFEISGIHLDDKLVRSSAAVKAKRRTVGETVANGVSCLQRKEAVALHVKLLDLSNEFLLGSHMPNRIARSVIPQHLHLHFASEGSFVQVGGLHADSPDDLVRAPLYSTAVCPAGGAFAAQGALRIDFPEVVLVSAHQTAKHV